MNSMERVMKTMNHEEPDRVPVFLLTTMHGAKELNLSIKDYFSRADNVVEGQLRLLEKYRSDSLDATYYSSLEVEAFGGKTLFIENGPPNTSSPVIHKREDIDDLKVPDINKSDCLLRGVETISKLKERVGNSVPILVTVISPFSLPIMQMGFDHYIDLIYEDQLRFDRLMKINMEFCVQWANAQIKAGATAVGYADPMSSTTNIPRELYLRTGYVIAKETLSRITGDCAIHFASGRALSLAKDIISTGSPAVAVSTMEDLAEWKSAVGNQMTIIGNLNAIEMRHWDEEKTEFEVKRAISAAGKGGGFILSDNHGEIPWQVPDEVIISIRRAVDKWGNYPLDWI